MELRMGRGKGYVTSEEMTIENESDIDIVPVDAVFTPIKSVQFHVDNVGLASVQTMRSFPWKFTTDGSINPKEAFTIAGKILKDHIEKFITEQIDEPFSQEEDEVDAEKVRIANLLKTSIEDLNLSVRAYNCLKSANINTIAELVSKDETELLKFRNFGRKSLAELTEVIEEKNLHFGMDVDKYMDE
jgi:DNA-directed RNA polymerase subunit alpha